MFEPTAIYAPNPHRYDTMTYNRAGTSGLKLPAVSLGFWHNFGDITPFDQMKSLVFTAFDNGITHFDLANNYGPEPGQAEKNCGLLLTKYFKHHRDELIISTKAGYDMWPGPYGNWGSRKYLMASLEQSLRRMHLDYVDLFYSHRFDPETPLEETLQALVDIVRQGKALYVGISRWPLEALQKADEYLRAHDVPLLIFQDRLNLLDREPINKGTLDYCREHGIGFISFSSLAQGLLTDRYLKGIPSDSRMARGQFLTQDKLTPKLLDYLRKLNQTAKQRGESLAGMALAWILQQPGVTSVLVGASSTAQLEKNMECVQAKPIQQLSM